MGYAVALHGPALEFLVLPVDRAMRRCEVGCSPCFAYQGGRGGGHGGTPGVSGRRRQLSSLGLDLIEATHKVKVRDLCVES